MCSPIRPTVDNHPQSSSPNKEGTVRELRPHKDFHCTRPDSTGKARRPCAEEANERTKGCLTGKKSHPGAEDSPPGIRGLNLANTNGQDVNSLHNGANVLNVVNRNCMSCPNVDQNPSAPAEQHIRNYPPTVQRRGQEHLPLSILSLNAQGLTSKFALLNDLIEHSPDVLAITET